MTLPFIPAIFRGVGSGDSALIMNAAVAAAKAASILGVPAVLRSKRTSMV
ncbi:MAG: hypothetical protein ACR2GG_09770 [Gemmatimonadaceae bacterium]